MELNKIHRVLRLSSFIGYFFSVTGRTLYFACFNKLYIIFFIHMSYTFVRKVSEI